MLVLRAGLLASGINAVFSGKQSGAKENRRERKRLTAAMGLCYATAPKFRRLSALKGRLASACGCLLLVRVRSV